MPNAAEIIKRAAIEAVQSAKPCEVAFGTVTSTEPLTVRIDQKLSLERGQLVFLSSTPELASGDRLVLLRVQGGQLYVILDKAR